jgi:hypothetical protein
MFAKDIVIAAGASVQVVMTDPHTPTAIPAKAGTQ